MSVLVGMTAAAPVGAAPLSCGQVVTSSTSLDADLDCPTGDALIVQGNDIVLNLNGHTIRGQLQTKQVTQATGIGDNGELGSPYTVRYTTGQFAGVRVRGSRNTVTGPGTVKHFASGIIVDGGGQYTVKSLIVEQNLGPPGTADLGDGIYVFASTDNSIIGNIVRDNGPYDGIVLLGASTRNLVQANQVIDNKQPEICPEYDLYRFSVSGGGIVHQCGPTHPSVKPYFFFNQQNHGIKFEGVGGGAPYENRIMGNMITGNGNTGVFFPSTCPDFGPGATCPGEQIRDNLVQGNLVNRNGYGYPTGSRSAAVFEGPANGGSGITMMIGGPKPPIRQTITGNTVNENAKHGITVLNHRAGNPQTMSTITGNTALRNNGLPGGGNAYNAMDGNAFLNPDAPCDSNVWSNNYFGRTAADVGGPVPPNNLTNHPCVGPVLTG